MKLAKILGFEHKLGDLEISGITYDSRKVEKNFVFVNTNGLPEFDRDAVAKGASVIVTKNDIGFENTILVENPPQMFAVMCANWFGNPAKDLKFLGVTGTNGKTSVTYMLQAILKKAGKKVGVIGTNQYMVGEKIKPAINTTPNPYYLNELFYEMKREKCEYVVMEVSSHSLIFENVYGLDFEVAMFTNLTQDHLDFHGTIEEYYLAKKKLFSMCEKAVVNVDDSFGERLYNEIQCEKIAYSVKNTTDYTAKAVTCMPSQIKYELLSEGLAHIKVNTGGNFTVYNSLCAIACALEIGISIDDVKSALAEFGGVKGRAEVVPDTKDFTVIIDYAHTPDGLKNILKTFKECAKNRLIVLFGCGGDRDSTKRPLMGEIASIYADYVIVTSDNPRTENPTQIIEDIMKGIPSKLFNGKVIEDRREAIKFALSIGQKDDIIVLAGKGHETYQIIGKEKFPFDEREIIKSALS
ncbi:MAG: UDP-N-acetylmuramoyl-L-alanyl-D-glutamate--2,6-diaminopimelate ligase [Ruminococcaceae bacterium]|nr:UDP-N-acetylmuramoyl-L-alanyl-D-glutamate--2,6-diaminopimelate ligase [Oscillospiraceae bacterium]